MEAGVFAFVAFVAAFGCAFVVGRSVFLGLERAMAATRGVAYVSQKACVRGAMNGRGAGRFAASRARVRDAVCRMSLYYMRNGVASFLPFGRRIVSTPAGQSFRDAARLATRKGVDTTPEGLASLFCHFGAHFRGFAVCGVSVACGGALCAGSFCRCAAGFVDSRY